MPVRGRAHLERHLQHDRRGEQKPSNGDGAEARQVGELSAIARRGTEWVAGGENVFVTSGLQTTVYTTPSLFTLYSLPRPPHARTHARTHAHTHTIPHHALDVAQRQQHKHAKRSDEQLAVCGPVVLSQSGDQ
eukprot:36212-Chlamydomonas_euryale.AAC.1